MVKIIHTADIHLGSKIEAKFSDVQSAERKREVRLAFKNMIEYAVQNGVKVVMLCGDVFDSDFPLKKDKEFFFNLVENYPSVDFLYLKGNHDSDMFSEHPENLKTFSDKWCSYRYGNVNISGIELTAENSLSFHNELNLDKTDFNIVMLHGQVSLSPGTEKIVLSKLAGKNIDYLALGHVHKREEGVLDNRGIYRYSGCLEGRGFDEMGEKGFYLLETDGQTLQSKFVVNSIRTITSFEVDISAAKDSFDASNIVKKAVDAKKSDIVRVFLKGELDFYDPSLCSDVESYLEGQWYVLSVKDKTDFKLDLTASENDSTLRGAFIKEVNSNPDLSEQQKKEIIALGLNALAGREVLK